MKFHNFLEKSSKKKKKFTTFFSFPGTIKSTLISKKQCNLKTNFTKGSSNPCHNQNFTAQTIKAQVQAPMASVLVLSDSCKDNSAVFHHLDQTSVPSRKIHFALHPMH